MRWEVERLERTAMLAAAGLGLLLLAAAGVQRQRGSSEEDALEARFTELCRAMGLAATTAAVPHPEQWCWGRAGTAADAPPVLMHWYVGSPTAPTVKGIAVTMPVGVLPGGGWGVELDGAAPRYWGDGTGEAELRILLTPPVLEQARRIPVVALMPTARVDSQSELAQVIRHHWPAGWEGLAIRALLGRISERPQAQMVFQQMGTLRAALRGEPLSPAPALSPPGTP